MWKNNWQRITLIFSLVRFYVKCTEMVTKNELVGAILIILLLKIQLLEKKKRVQLKDMGEDLECLCQIMRTVGPRLDHAKAKVSIA